MPSLSELHNELRVRVPNKPYEFYNDALRWAIDKICRKTSMWEIITTIVTEADKSVYNLELPTLTVTHSNLYIIHKGNTDRRINRPVNSRVSLTQAPSDYIQSFATYSKNEIEIFPTPVDGGQTLEVHTSVKPIKGVTEVKNEKFFDEYSDTVVYGALSRIYGDDDPIKADRNEMKFNKGVSSIHVDVLKGNADTPMKLFAGW